ncbi:hypothetical protein [Rhodopirellula baltica]
MANCNHPAKSYRHIDVSLYQTMSDDLHLAAFSKRTVHSCLEFVRQLAGQAQSQFVHVIEQHF